MNRIYVLVPLFATAAFAIYYHQQPELIVCQKNAGGIYTDPYQFRDGSKEAERALAEGKLIILTFGLPAPCFLESQEVLKQNYGVEKRVVAGCVVTTPLVEFTRAYNAVMDREITARFGTDVYEKVSEQARALYNERNPPAARIGQADR